MARILIVDDERYICSTMKDIFENEKYLVETASNPIEALDIIKSATFDLILSDIIMPKMTGLEFLVKLQEINFEAPVIVMSAHGDIQTAVDCIKKGAFDFLEKPIDLNRLLLSVRNALSNVSLAKETRTLKRKIQKNYELIGVSPSIQKVRHMIDVLASTDSRVLITGDNGTGKEVVARQIYLSSKRADKPFIEVNCAAIPSELIESELFGHEKGAFTSAVKTRAGKFEQADGGTIFLDEIGDMSLSAQAKILRCLQENVISPVGSDKLIRIDVRVLAATNKDLRREIDNGNFREDLFHRLNVVPIHIDPLSKRPEDIPLLVDHFNKIISGSQGHPVKQFAPDAIELLQAMPWRGNVRELHNIVERLLILCGDTITAADVGEYA
ncbi:MAG: sigma-54-dependent transcriptional regulator [Candidatus Aphodosoma sp.]